jgi:DNA-binding NarL/FixJ family response regulator
VADGSRPVTLLICDDHRVLTDALAIVVGLDDGLELVAPPSQDPQSAIALCAEFLPDVVLMDVDLKAEMSGIDATRAIKENSPATKVIIMTAHDDDRLLVDAVEAGASGFLSKDDAAQEVLTAVKAAADGEVLIDPATLARLLPQVAREREMKRDAPRAAQRSDRPRARDPFSARSGHAQRRHRRQALHQPPDRADARAQHPGQASGPLEARGGCVRRPIRRHLRLAGRRRHLLS